MKNGLAQKTLALAALFLAARPLLAQDAFYHGVFTDGNNTDASTLFTEISTMGLNSVFFVNNTTSRDEPKLNQADALGLKIIFGPVGDLEEDWFCSNPSHPCSAPAPTIENARQLIYPITLAVRHHPSLVGYNMVDDARPWQADRIALAYQAFHESDPSRRTTPTYIGSKSSHDLMPTNGFFSYNYPAKEVRPPCDFTYGSDGQTYRFQTSGFNTFPQAIRQFSRFKRADVPLWFAVQTHGVVRHHNPAGNPVGLRTPTVEEVRLQHWLAVGEGVQGLYWFVWDSGDQFPDSGDLRNNAPFKTEIADLVRRTKARWPQMGSWKKQPDSFSAVPAAALPFAHQPYASTMKGADGKNYVVAANCSCAPQTISVQSSLASGQLRDLETGQVYNLNAGIPFRGGDGRIFELINGGVGAPPVPTPVNLVDNFSFETANGGPAAGWSGSVALTARDTGVAHSGGASLRVSGAGGAYIHQAITLKANTLYTVSYWVKTSTVTGSGLRVRYPQTAYANQGELQWDFVSGTTDWKHVEDSFYSAMVPGGRLDIQWVMDGGTAWVDDVQLCEGAVCPPLDLPVDRTPPPAPRGVRRR